MYKVICTRRSLALEATRRIPYKSSRDIQKVNGKKCSKKVKAGKSSEWIIKECCGLLKRTRKELKKTRFESSPIKLRASSRVHICPSFKGPFGKS